MKKNFVCKRIAKCAGFCFALSFTMSFAGCIEKIAVQPLAENSSRENPADDNGGSVVPGQTGDGVVMAQAVNTVLFNNTFTDKKAIDTRVYSYYTSASNMQHAYINRPILPLG
jgi:hypothetical protein